MVKSRLIRATAVAAASAGLIVGFTGLAGASSGSILNTGPDSSNKVITKNSMVVKLHNHNMVALDNSNSQSAYTGSAKVTHNTTGGGATSGDASNDNSTGLNVHVMNSTPSLTGLSGMGAATGGSIEKTGPDSFNLVVNKNTMTLDVHNTNDVALSNSSSQSATSGKATVSDNTTGGSATSGDAANTNDTTLSVTVSN